MEATFVHQAALRRRAGQTRCLRVGLSTLAVLGLAAASCTGGSNPCLEGPRPGQEPGRAGFALLFCGTQGGGVDRVKVAIDDPSGRRGGPPLDVGRDFTIEWWMKATLRQNPTPGVSGGPNVNWIHGNILFDRDRYDLGRKFGVSISGGRVLFGVTGEVGDDRTINGRSIVADGRWHHVAVQRRVTDGRLTIYVDGRLEGEALGPKGDVSYPDDGIPLNRCGGPCVKSDPYFVIGAEKHDSGGGWPGYGGFLDEVRVSSTVRYAANFRRPTTRFEPDAHTVALWHFDEGQGTTLVDSSTNATHGELQIGGERRTPRWMTSDAPID